MNDVSSMTKLLEPAEDGPLHADRHCTAPTLWVHVSTLMNWSRPPVGIVRVEQEYCRWLLARSDASGARFCVYDRHAGAFREVHREAVAERLRAAHAPAHAAASSPAASLTGWKRHARTVWRRLLPYIPPQTAVDLRDRLRHEWRRARAVGHRVRDALRRPHAAAVADVGAPAAFARGDHWVSMGLDWDYLDQRALFRLKQRHALRITLVCYDVIPALFPQLVVLPPGGFGAYIVDLAWCADEVLCISEHTRRDLEALLLRLGAPVPSLRVFRLGSDVRSTHAAHPPPGFAHGPGERPFVLYVSTLERRKNHEVLYRAWTRLREGGMLPHRLVFVGMRGWGIGDLMQDLALDPRVRDDIILLDRVDDAQLEWLYRNCAFTVYPSLYEGWGLPLVESFAWGKFCLSSNAASLPEAGGTLAEYLDPWDLPAWTERLAHYMRHPEALAEREERIAREFAAPTWTETANQIHRVATSTAARRIP
ncbi:MAG TPA: glycosyltransferase family 1 protein [Zeimonas sp.]